ncbi:MAG: sigma-70 family RNA polymerase sigma factor [Armatimonadota bacterium]|nr:sigma-70 family RNA polymerase sigma factor [Armatimonadota bacterium]
MEHEAVEYAQVMRLPHADRGADKELVERCRDHDGAAFNEVLERYKTKVYNYLLRMMGNAADAEDLTQEVFVRLYTSLDSFRSQASLNTWLFRIAGNLCIDHFRRAKKHRAIAFSLDEPRDAEGAEAGGGKTYEVPDTTYEPHRVAEQAETAQQIQQALGQLPEKLRAVLILHDIEGLPYEEIAQIVGCPLGTVKSRLFNARLQLRQRLTSYLQS